MSPNADQYLRDHLDAANAVVWPAARDARVDVAQTLLGLWLVGKCDYWHEHARDLLSNPQPSEPYVRPDSPLARKEQSYRSAFATLDDRQRAAVLALLSDVVDGTMFGSRVTVDQFAHARVNVSLSNRDGEASYAVDVAPGPNGFGVHERWSEWLQRFGGARPTPE